MIRPRPLGRWATALAVITATAAVAAGCGGQPEDAASGPAPSPSDAPAAPPATAGPGAPTGTGGSGCQTFPEPTSGRGPGLVEQTAGAGLVDPLVGMLVHAVATADVDGDGWLDLFVGSFGDRPAEEYVVRGATGAAPDRLLRGGPDGFRADPSFPELRGRTSGALFADLDRDGDADLVAARNTRDREGDLDVARAPTVVLRNDGGTFGEPVELTAIGARAVVPLDIDDDGDLDLFVAADSGGGPCGRDGASALFRNDGDLRFTDVTAASGLPTDLVGFGATTADLDLDGELDLVVAGEERIFLADGGGGFADATPDGFGFERFGEEDLVTGVATGDLDGDGRPEVVLGHHFGSTTDDGRSVPVRIWHNGTTVPGSLALDEVTDDAGVPGFATKAPHVVVADMDDDGRPDVVVTASADGTVPTVLRNVGAPGDPIRLEAPDGLGAPQYWVTAAVADFDGDGRLDVVAAEFDAALPSLFFRGSGAAGHRLQVDLTSLPAGGVGASVSTYRPGSAGEADGLLSHDQPSGSVGYAAGAPGIAHIGLGATTEVDLVIQPGDGSPPLTLRSVRADQLVRPGGC